MTTTTQLDEARAEQFAGRVVQLLNDGMLALLVSVGHQTGLLDAMAGMAPATSDEIAQAAGLDERYVREWLAGMTVGRSSRTTRRPRPTRCRPSTRRA